MSADTVMQESAVPLCVDLDGTLIKTDLLVESVFLLLKHQPWALFKLPLWLMKLSDESTSCACRAARWLPLRVLPCTGSRVQFRV